MPSPTEKAKLESAARARLKTLKPKELTVSYSASMKIILPHNKFESASVHITRGETFDLAPGDDADTLYQERFFALQREIGDLCVQKYEAVKGGEL